MKILEAPEAASQAIPNRKPSSMRPNHIPSPSSIAALIISGGQARRMNGGDKGTTLVGGRSILARIIETIRPQVGTLALNANGDLERFAEFALPVVSDPPQGAGPLAGILAGLHWAAESGYEWLLTVPTDTPFLPFDLAMRLCLGLGGGSAAMATSGERSHPVSGLWSVSLAPLLHQMLMEDGERKVHAWARRCQAATVNWSDTPVDPFFNVNTPEDLQTACELAVLPNRYAGAILIPSHTSYADLLAAFAEEVRLDGFTTGGVLQVRGKGQDESDVGMLCLETGETYPIMQKLGRDSCCAVDTQSIASVSAALQSSINRKPDLIVVNKFGHLEESGEGLADEMMSAMAEGIRLLTTVSVKHLPAWLKFCGDQCTLLPPELSAIRRWWGG